jgi:3-oxoacyl-[acyl-carrier protein] reductase
MRHVIVTGGSRGLGEVLVEGLLESGYRVSACSRTQTEFIGRMQASERLGPRFFWQECAVGEEDDVNRFVSSACAWASDSLHGLINNAGIAQAGILATFPNVSSEEILRVNLLGAIQMARAASRQFLQSDAGGRIINISSIIGSRGYNGLAAYSASKAGLDGLTRALARELGRLQVTVNSIAPGYFETEMSAGLSGEQLGQIVRRTPLGRLATGQDILALVRFLLSDEAAFITGQTIRVDGGVSC